MALKVGEKRLLDKLGGPSKIHEGLLRYRDNVALLASKREELTSEYPNQWIAMRGGEVVSAANDFDELLQEIDAKELVHDELVIQFLNTDKRIFIL